MKDSLILPFTNHSRMNSIGGGSKTYVACEEFYLIDKGGKKFLDASSGILGNVLFGYKDSGIINKMSQQISQLPFLDAHNWSTSFSSNELVEELNKVFPNSGYKFMSSGTEAIETAIYLSKYIQLHRGCNQKKYVLKFEKSYHGSSLFLKDSVISITQPKGLDSSLLESLFSKIHEIGAENISCFLMEPIQAGNGGETPADLNFFESLYLGLKSRGIFLVYDEVVTGFGRTGAASYTQSLSLKSDIRAFGKSMGAGYIPMSMIEISPSLFEEFQTVDAVFSFGNSADSNPVGCTVAIEVLKKIHKFSASKNHHMTQTQFCKDLTKICLQYNISLKNFGSLFFITPSNLANTKHIKKELFRAGVILRENNGHLVLAPALNWDSITFSVFIENFERVLKRVIG